MVSSARRAARPVSRRKERSGADEAWTPGRQDWALCLVFTAVLVTAAGLYSLHVLLGATEPADASGKILFRVARQLETSRSAGVTDDFQRLYDAPGTKPELSAKNIAQPVPDTQVDALGTKPELLAKSVAQPVQDSKVDATTKQSNVFLPKGKGPPRSMKTMPNLQETTRSLRTMPDRQDHQQACLQADFSQSNVDGFIARGVVGTKVRGGYIFSWLDDGSRKLVLTDSAGVALKSGHMSSESKTWTDPSTWTLNTGWLVYSITNLQSCQGCFQADFLQSNVAGIAARGVRGFKISSGFIFPWEDPLDRDRIKLVLTDAAGVTLKSGYFEGEGDFWTDPSLWTESTGWLRYSLSNLQSCQGEAPAHYRQPRPGPAKNPEKDLAVPNQAIEQLCTPAKIRGLVAMLTQKLHATTTADKVTQAEQTVEALERAAQAWTRLLDFKFQVEYMRNRICSRMENWFTTLAELQPPWLPQQLGKNLPKALVWPYAAYIHFGVKRVWSLGEYSQWADLCAALASLGFEVVLWRFRVGKFFPNDGNYQEADIVFTDYNGVHAGKSVRSLPPGDLTWLLDTFGTDGTIVKHEFFGRIPPLTNYPLHRFLTLVPGFAVRNTFLGVAAVAGKANKPDAGSANPLPARKWQCVLWSKVHPWLREKNGFPAYHWKLLREYTKHCKVIATIDKKDTYKTEQLIRECCPEVEIRGVESPSGFLELLRSSAVYVGVGEPLIAPSCFEALSLGTHVIQPRFPQPRVLPNKPITQAWTSQHPFLEKVPQPFAYTVDPLNFSALAETFGTLRASYESIYGSSEAAVHSVPKDLQLALREFYATGDYPGREEFSIGGFLKRVANIVQNTKPLQAGDWDWELKDHPEQLPAIARGAAGK